MSDLNETTPTPQTLGTDQPPRRSRRAIRQAEREAEREALLTGQQRLLTRKELRRLREEAEALNAAVEAGEITLEQARALQDPLAHQPVITTAPLRTTGVHAAVSDSEPAQPAQSDEEAQKTSRVARRASTAASELSGFVTTTGPDTAEKEALSQIATGVMDPVDLPAVTHPRHAAPPEPPSAEPSVPERKSVLRKPAQSGEDGLVPGPLVPGRVPSATPVSPPVSPVGTHHARTDVPTVLQSHASSYPSDEAVAASSSDEAVDGAETPPPAVPSTPTRRPIVRIPASAQGVRTVNAATGELSAVTPLNDEGVVIETPQWKALHATYAGSATGRAPEQEQATAHASVGARLGDAERREDTSDNTAAAQSDWVDVPGPAEQTGEAEEPHSLGRHILLALTVLVIVLVVATLVWFYMGKNHDTQALVSGFASGLDARFLCSSL